MNDQKHEHHIIPLSTYFKVFGALMVLTVLTVAVTKVDLGSPLNVILAMLIAIIKSSLVLMFFMHLYYDNRTNLVFFLGSVLFMIIFIVFTLMDIDYRDKIYKIEGESPQGKKTYKEYITKQPPTDSSH
tara:strand:- start:2123 stop:2509 length:387 start_codon:yes stop_codon:yes gene_type:complete